MSLQVDDVLATGSEQRPGSAPLSGSYACYDTYRCSDGGWISVGAIEAKFWANFCTALGLPECIDVQMDESAQDDVRRKVAAVIAGRPRDEWVAELAPADTCVAPVLSATEVAADPALAARNLLATGHPVSGSDFPQLAPLLAGTERASDYTLPDRSATDTSELLTAAGLTTDEITALRDEGVIN